MRKDSVEIYSAPAKPSLNHWGLNGSWNLNAEGAVLQAVPGKIVFRFHSRDLHLVLAPAKDVKPVRFVVRLDGAAPDHLRSAPAWTASPKRSGATPANTNAFHRTHVEFGKHWSLSALA
jgi:hypothetical protein